MAALRVDVWLGEGCGVVEWHAAERVLTLVLYPPVRGGSGQRHASFKTNRGAIAELDGDGIDAAREYLAACMEDAAALAQAIPIAEEWVNNGVMPERDCSQEGG